MRTDNLATTIQDLREMAKKDPSTPITNAIAYLDIFLEELCTKELPSSQLSAGAIHHRMVCPLPDWESFHDQMMVKICSDFEVKIDELLANYEEVYGLEKVTYDELSEFIERNAGIAKITHGNSQVECYGYKIYKKKVR